MNDIVRSTLQLQNVFDGIPDPIFVKDRQHRWVAFNDAFCKLLGRTRDELFGRSDPDFFPPEQVEVFWRMDDELFQSGRPNDNEEFIIDAAGKPHLIWTRKFPMRNESGELFALCGIISDLADTVIQDRLDRAERAIREHHDQSLLIEAQDAMLDALAMPIVAVWDGILLVPLVGKISERRAARALQLLLEEILRTQADLVIIDVTGVPFIDERTADHLLKAITAAELLGARCELCGIVPHVAQALVNLNVDLKQLVTHARLQDALRTELQQRSRRTSRSAKYARVSR